MWNLKAKGVMQIVPKVVTYIFALVPVVIIGLMAHDLGDFKNTFFKNENLPIYVIIWGSLGQFIYKMRFVYQWYYSVKRQQSLLPVTFWWIAFFGSIMIIVYGIYRLDWILILGQLGIVATIRNIVIGTRARQA